MEELKEEDITELKEVEDVKEKEEKEGEEEHIQSPHFEAEMENMESESNEKETRDENKLESVLSETSTQTEKTQMEEERREEENRRQEEVEEIKGEMKEEEAAEKQEMENVEGERRDKEEEGSLKCSRELCPEASEDGQRDGDGSDSANRLSSADEGAIEAEKPNPMADNDQISADRTGGSQTVSFEGMERGEDRVQEENRSDDAEADEGKHVSSNNANGISDLSALGGEIEYTDSDLLYSGESLPNPILLGQTAENKDEEAENTDLPDANVLRQGDKTEPEDTETSSSGISTEQKTEQILSDYKMDTEDTDREEREIDLKDGDVGDEDSTVGSEFRTEGGMGTSVSSSDPVESQAVTSEQSQHPAGSSLLSDGVNKGTAETKSGGAFGLFKNAFSLFSQTEESTKSAPSLDSDTAGTSETQDSLTPEQDLDSTTDSTRVYTQDSHTDAPISQSQQPSPPSPTQTHSPNTGSPLQTKTISKHYKNLLVYVSAEETTILMELFGRHKLQFLDYMLGSSETTMDDPDRDESILLDIERLLHYHREALVAPGRRFAEAPQEDKEKTRTLIALQKLETLLARVRETFNTGKSDISNTNHQGIFVYMASNIMADISETLSSFI